MTESRPESKGSEARQVVSATATPFGLRAQILAALTLAFALSFAFLGVVAVQLMEQARRTDRVQSAEVTARALAGAIERGQVHDRASLGALADSVVGRAGIVGLEVDIPGLHESFARGLVSSEIVVRSRFSRGGEVRLWLHSPALEETGPAANLLLLYVALTGGAILLLAYIALTYLIVRPVTAVTRAAERLASGQMHVEVPTRGAAEVARLALAFNSMSAQLRTDRQALEERLRELEQTTSDLETAQDQVLRSERLASVGRLSAGVAHEIGNPLSAILGLVELVQDGDLDETEQAEFLRRIQVETERINKIIRELLDFARPPGNEAEEATDLASVVDDARRLVAPQKSLRNVSIEVHADPGLPLVKGTNDRLSQMLVNLLLNAADAVDGDGKIDVILQARETGVLLQVRDTGPGFDPEVLPHVFEPFVTTKPSGKGTGLGMAVCHTIVIVSEARFDVRNHESGGASVEVFLPSAGTSTAPHVVRYYAVAWQTTSKSTRPKRRSTTAWLERKTSRETSRPRSASTSVPRGVGLLRSAAEPGA